MADGTGGDQSELAMKALHLSDEIGMTLAHLESSISMTYGCAGEAFREMNDILQDNYLWHVATQIGHLAKKWEQHQEVARQLRQRPA